MPTPGLLTAIYNTRSSADHIGGNARLQKRGGCKGYALGIDGDFTSHPVLEPGFLYGGCPPRKKTCHSAKTNIPSGGSQRHTDAECLVLSGFTGTDGAKNGNVRKPNCLFSFTLESKTRSSKTLWQVDVLVELPEGDVSSHTAPKGGEVK